MKEIKVVTIIPARGGSKGIPRKNIVKMMLKEPKWNKLIEKVKELKNQSDIKKRCL